MSPAGRQGAHAVARPYHVGRARARAQLLQALAAKDDSTKDRRLKQVLDVDLLDREDPENKALLVLASRELRQLSKVRRKAAVGAHRPPEGSPRRGLLEVDLDGRGRAPGGDYAWIRKANEEADREARRAISALTRQAVAAGGYQLGNASVHLRRVRAMLSGTRLLSPSLTKAAIWPRTSELAGASRFCQTKLSVSRGTVLEVAAARARAGRRVAAVSAASGYHAGGGFLTGGRHALEEAMCVQSTLYESLEKGVALAEAAGVVAPSWVRPARHPRDGTEWLAHLPDDGALLSPSVEVFRAGTNEGYPFEDAPVTLDAIVSVAMPNCNDRMSDSPVDAQPEARAYELQLEQKWRAALAAAACYTMATCLVVPDAGCGVFRNPPEQVGKAFGDVLRSEFRSRFEEVVIAFPGGNAGQEFAAAATAAFQGSAPAPAEVAQRSAAAASWEFSVKAGFTPFDEDCQFALEQQYASFRSGGPSHAKVKSRGQTIVVDFLEMTQHVEGSDRQRSVRRRCLS